MHQIADEKPYCVGRKRKQYTKNTFETTKRVKGSYTNYVRSKNDFGKTQTKSAQWAEKFSLISKHEFPTIMELIIDYIETFAADLATNLCDVAQIDK